MEVLRLKTFFLEFPYYESSVTTTLYRFHSKHSQQIDGKQPPFMFLMHIGIETRKKDEIN